MPFLVGFFLGILVTIAAAIAYLMDGKLDKLADERRRIDADSRRRASSLRSSSARRPARSGGDHRAIGDW